MSISIAGGPADAHRRLRRKPGAKRQARHYATAIAFLPATALFACLLALLDPYAAGAVIVAVLILLARD